MRNFCLYMYIITVSTVTWILLYVYIGFFKWNSVFFSVGVLKENGEINRKVLGPIVFSDKVWNLSPNETGMRRGQVSFVKLSSLRV